MITKKTSLFTIFFVLTLFLHDRTAYTQIENWTHFRGNKLDGIAEAANIPVIFNDSTNVKWKTEISERGWSSPVVYDNQIWVTTASPEGKEL